MKRINIVLIILLTILLSVVVNIFFGGYLSARLSTLPIMRDWNVLDPRAPIVINNKETVRVSDANDAVETISGIKSKLATLVYYEEEKIIAAGALLNWTSDGYFITSTKAFLVPGKTYAVVLNNGEIYPIKEVFPDTASNLVLISTDVRGLSTVDTIEDKELRPAQKVLFASNSIPANTVTFLESYVRALSNDVANVEFDSDRVVRGVSVQTVTPLMPGTPALNLSGRVGGIWDGTAVISGDAIRTFANNFFNENKVVNRPSFGFKYRHITEAESRALKVEVGAQVTTVTVSGVSAAAGLLAGDVITLVDDQKVSEGVLLETLLEQVRPGERVVLSIMRGGSPQTITVTPIALK